MRIISREPASESVAFQHSYARELGARVVPRWLREVLGAALWVIIFSVTYLIISDGAKAFAVTYSALLIQLVWQKGFAYWYRKRAARYLASFPDADLYVYELGESGFISEHRGMKYVFPMSAFAHTFEDTRNIYFDFSSLGRVRVPLNAFKSVEERQEFVRIAMLMRKPNQSKDPTP
jgi:hypothetical protein